MVHHKPIYELSAYKRSKHENLSVTEDISKMDTADVKRIVDTLKQSGVG